MMSLAASYHGYRFPPEIISHAVWLYHRFCLSLALVHGSCPLGENRRYLAILTGDGA